MNNLLCEFPHEVEGHASEVGVADEVIEIEGEDLEDETKMVAVLKVTEKFDYEG